MPNRFNGFKVGQRNGIWVEFNKTYLNEVGRRYYKFKCNLEPIFCVSDNMVYAMQYRDQTYLISEFTVMSDKSGNYIHSVRLGDQNHPHKDPRNGFLCIGDFKGKVLHPETVKQMILCCMLKYNETDCFCVPDIRIAYKNQWRELNA